GGRHARWPGRLGHVCPGARVSALAARPHAGHDWQHAGRRDFRRRGGCAGQGCDGADPSGTGPRHAPRHPAGRRARGASERPPVAPCTPPASRGNHQYHCGTRVVGSAERVGPRLRFSHWALGHPGTGDRPREQRGVCYNHAGCLSAAREVAHSRNVCTSTCRFPTRPHHDARLPGPRAVGLARLPRWVHGGGGASAVAQVRAEPLRPAARVGGSPAMGLARSSGGGPLVLALMCLISLNLRSVSVGVSPVLPLVRADFAVSYALAGVLFALPIAMMGLWAEPGRRLVDRWGPWRAIALSLALLVTGGGLRALAPNYWTMLALTA